MAVTPTTFLARFPGVFDEAHADFPTLIQTVIDEAELQVSATVWGNKRDLGITYLTAHLLSCDPNGEPARLATDEAMTIYLKTFNMLKKQVAGGYRVAGDIVTPVDPCG